MDLLPLLQTALLLFGSVTLLFLFSSFFIYKLKKGHQPATHVEAEYPLAVQPIPVYSTRGDNIVHTIAIPESGVMSHREEELQQVQQYSPYPPINYQRRTNYAIVNNSAETVKKVRINPYTMFR